MRHLPGLDLTMSVCLCLHGKGNGLDFVMPRCTGSGTILLVSLFLWASLALELIVSTGLEELDFLPACLFLLLLSVGNCVGVHTTHIRLPRCCALALGLAVRNNATIEYLDSLTCRIRSYYEFVECHRQSDPVRTLLLITT